MIIIHSSLAKLEDLCFFMIKNNIIDGIKF